MRESDNETMESGINRPTREHPYTKSDRNPKHDLSPTTKLNSM